jgi:hypothetical protein
MCIYVYLYICVHVCLHHDLTPLRSGYLNVTVRISSDCRNDCAPLGGRWQRHCASTLRLYRSTSASIVRVRAEGGRWGRDTAPGVNTTIASLDLGNNGLREGVGLNPASYHSPGKALDM